MVTVTDAGDAGVVGSQSSVAFPVWWLLSSHLIHWFPRSRMRPSVMWQVPDL